MFTWKTRVTWSYTALTPQYRWPCLAILSSRHLPALFFLIRVFQPFYNILPILFNLSFVSTALSPFVFPKPSRSSLSANHLTFHPMRKLKVIRLELPELPPQNLKTKNTYSTLSSFSPVSGWLLLQFKTNPSIWSLPPPQETLTLLIITFISFMLSFPFTWSFLTAYKYFHLFSLKKQLLLVHTLLLSPSSSLFSFLQSKVCKVYLLLLSALSSPSHLKVYCHLPSGKHPSYTNKIVL